MTYASINVEGLEGVKKDLGSNARAVRDEVLPFRREFQDLGLDTRAFNSLQGIHADLDERVIPEVTDRHSRAVEIQNQSPTKPKNIEIRDSPKPGIPNDSSSGPTNDGYTTATDTTGIQVVSWEPKAEEVEQEKEEEDSGFSLSGAWDWAKDKASDAGDWLSEKFGSAITWLQGAGEDFTDWVSDAWGDVSAWWDDWTKTAGDWIDDNWKGFRDWIKSQAGLLRVLATILKVVGWIVVVVGVVILATTFWTGIGAGVGLLIIGAGFTIVGGGDLLDTLVDWGEGKITGQQLVQQGVVDLAVTILSFVGVGIAAKVIKEIVKHLPASWLKKMEELLEKLLKRKRPGPGSRPGIETDLVDPPGTYTVKVPAEKFRGMKQPSREDLQDVGTNPSAYPEGSIERIMSARKRYLDEQRQKGLKPKPWDKWRDQYITNQGNKTQGDAYEQLFWDRHGFDAKDGWRSGESGKGGKPDPIEFTDSTGKTHNRKMDLWDDKTKTGYEIKSGNSVDKNQVDVDAKLVKEKGWDVVYIFGKEPSDSTKKLLEQNGIKYKVWSGDPDRVP
ncbi:hypothetical protein LWF01_02395 [Saxibacter everestensis]|uniref:Tox-REase-5 domain-containing protein n=1 Tax=Saxibacter everestensis TaxID=2909229 RepID=A0ABY8QWJ0_9MICO|nr:hypothetical protein LWF01_02395 [Brevibacteriaceae bacterium ZFBP1038]